MEGHWQRCTPAVISQDGQWNGFSAVAYFFARDIQQFTGKPLGVIASHWGGTPAQARTSLTGLQKPPAFTNYAEQGRSNLDVYMKNKAAVPDPGQASSLYNGMIAPLIPYALKGVIWYQGESNAGAAAEYRSLFPRMITDWREKWSQGDFPFFFVQIAGFSGGSANDNYPLLRDSQFKTLAAVPATGMATAIDIGAGGDIHPSDKQDVGTRLALAAKHLAYGQSNVYSGPLYQAMRVEGNRIRIAFTEIGGGLTPGLSPLARPGTPVLSSLTGFTVAGLDHKWHPAAVRIDGKYILVASSEVPAPVAVRYDWAGDPDGNLYNKEGLPASPFRTDDWPHTAEPEPNTIPVAQSWLKECEDRVAAFKNKRCDVIFIGDSITQNFVEKPSNGWNLVGRSVWDKHYGGRPFLDFGVGGDSTQNALWRMEHLDIKDLRPKVAVIMLGMNNQNDTAEDIAGGVKAVIDRTRFMFPAAKIALMSVTANGRMTEKTPRINALLKDCADEKSVFYVDLYSLMTPASPNSWKGVGGDQVHLTPEGYELWVKALSPILQKLL